METILEKRILRTSFNPGAIVDNIHPGLYTGVVPDIVGLHAMVVRSHCKGTVVYASQKSLPEIQRKYKGAIIKYLGVIHHDIKPFNRYRKPVEANADFDTSDTYEEGIFDEWVGESQDDLLQIIINKEPEKVTEPDFNDFWEAFGNKKDIIKTKEIWSTLSVNDKAQVMTNVPIYVNGLPSKFMQISPFSYLSGRRWEVASS